MSQNHMKPVKITKKNICTQEYVCIDHAYLPPPPSSAPPTYLDIWSKILTENKQLTKNI